MNTPLTATMATAPLARRDLFASPFDDFFNDAWMRPGWLADMPAVARARMDVIDQGGAFEIRADMPGVTKDDIDVTVDGQHVSIRAEKKSEHEVKDGDRVLHTERTAMRYARSFELPAEVTDAGATAAYDNGVLTLTLPKRAPTASHRLTVR